VRRSPHDGAARRSALWAFYDHELWRDVRAADARGDVGRLAALLGRAVLFERLVASLGDQPRLGEVRRANQWLVRRVLELTLARRSGERDAEPVEEERAARDAEAERDEADAPPPRQPAPEVHRARHEEHEA
jgi:hypothetical protein